MMRDAPSCREFVAVFSTLLCLFTVTASYAAADSELWEFVRRSLTTPAIMAECGGMHGIRSHIDKRKSGIWTQVDKSAPVVQRRIFEVGADDGVPDADEQELGDSSGLLFGPSYAIAEHLEFDLLFGLKSDRSSFPGTYHNGWGGAYGYAAEIQTSVEYRTDFLLNLRAPFVYRSVVLEKQGLGVAIAPSLSIKHISYSVRVSGNRWWYQYGENAADAQQREPEQMTLNTDGGFKITEFGFSFSLGSSTPTRNRTRVAGGWKCDLDKLFRSPVSSGIFFFGATVDLRHAPDPEGR